MAHQDRSSALTPVSSDARVFDTGAHRSLWFSLGVGLLVMQVGAYLVPAVGTQDALLAILLGSILGAGLLAWAAKLGCDSGLSSAGLMHRVFGTAFAQLPVLLNIVQLLGWTTFELVIMREGTQAILAKALGWTPGQAGLVWATLLWGGVLALLMLGSMLTLVRQFVCRFGLPLVVLSLLWLSWQFGSLTIDKGFGAFWQRQGSGGISFWAAIDLVIAMPVSWLPLVADYARHGINGRSTLRGTWLGYALANTWCYALGVLVISVSAPDTNLVTALLLAQGGLLALGLILLDELDNAYGDVYSAAVSGNSLLARVPVRTMGLTLALVCTGLAVVLPMHDLEPFLLKLSSVFVPLYGVILGRLALGGLALQAVERRVDWAAAAIWLIGVALFQALSAWAPQWGASLPVLAVTFALARLSRAKA